MTSTKDNNIFSSNMAEFEFSSSVAKKLAYDYVANCRKLKKQVDEDEVIDFIRRSFAENVIMELEDFLFEAESEE